jgi:hypothetical protein
MFLQQFFLAKNERLNAGFCRMIGEFDRCAETELVKTVVDTNQELMLR